MSIDISVLIISAVLKLYTMFPRTQRNKLNAKYIFVAGALIVLFLIRLIPITVKIQSNIKSFPKYDQYYKIINLHTLESSNRYLYKCFNGKLAKTIAKLKDNLETLSTSVKPKCQTLLSKFQSLYKLEVKRGSNIITPPLLATKVKKWLHNDHDLFNMFRNQSIVSVYNKFNFEHAIYNTLRAKRPMPRSLQNARTFIDQLVETTKESCDFCNYKVTTAVDELQQIESTYSLSVSNVFKLGKWHGLFLTKKHHPLNITKVEIIDLFRTALKWFRNVYNHNNTYRFPIMMWDSLPHAGNDYIHPNLHGILGRGKYPGMLNVQHVAAVRYENKFGRSYWNDILEVHYALGLATIFGRAIAITPLTSIKDHEVLLISDRPNTDLFQLLFYVLQAYYHGLSVFCYNSGMAFPPIDSNKTESLPALIRIGSRGDCNSVRSDASSAELYSASNINVDPYISIQNIKEALQWHQRKK